MTPLLKETWKEIAFLMGLGGGFWYTLEPNIGVESGVFSGFVSAFALAAVLETRSIVNQYSAHAVFRIALVVLGFAFLFVSVPLFSTYLVDRSNLTFEYETNTGPVRVVRGTVYHPDIFKAKYEEKLSDSALLVKAGGPNRRDLIWTRSSIILSEKKLAMEYVLTSLSTLISLIFFIEVLRIGIDVRKRP